MNNLLKIGIVGGLVFTAWKAFKGFSLKKSGENLTVLVSYLGDVSTGGEGLYLTLKFKFYNASDEQFDLRIRNVKISYADNPLIFKEPDYSVVKILPNATTETEGIVLNISYVSLLTSKLIDDIFLTKKFSKDSLNDMVRKLNYAVLTDINGITIEYKANITA